MGLLAGNPNLTNNKAADQPAHAQSNLRLCYSLLESCYMQNFNIQLVSVADQVLVVTPKDRLYRDKAYIMC